jgi:hypothetical protein
MVETGRPAGAPARVEIHIDELVLSGFASANRSAIQEAVAAELARLLAEPEAAAFLNTLARQGHSFDLARLNAGSFQMAQDAPAERIGAQVADALWKSVSQPGK